MPEQDMMLEVDARLIETSKVNARCCYDGYNAYQPVQACWT